MGTSSIQWNTQRQYTSEGQPIVAIQLASGRIQFHDCARGISGQLGVDYTSLCRASIMLAYDASDYEAITLSPELRRVVENRVNIVAK